MKKLLTLLLATTAFACTPKHNLEIRLKGLDNETLILRTMPLDDYIADNYDNMQTDTLVAHNGIIKTNIQTNEIDIFDTVISCAKACGIQNGKTSISTRLNGQVKSPYKNTWLFEYYDE